MVFCGLIVGPARYAATLRLAAVFKDDDGRVKFECAAVSRIDWRRRRRDESLTKLADARCPSVSQDSCCKVKKNRRSARAGRFSHLVAVPLIY